MVTTILRINPDISPTANDWFNSKFEMVKQCFDSFIGAGGSNTELIVILDRCDGHPEFEELVMPYAKYIHKGNWGSKRDTITVMYEMAHDRATGDVLLFLEDDYLWQNDQFAMDKVEEATKHFKLISPYDHPGHYRQNHAHEIWPLDYANGEKGLWRRAVTSTHTFAVLRDEFLARGEQFYFGDHDWQQFTYLHINGLTLWSPIYSLATHLAKGCESFGYDWKNIQKGGERGRFTKE